MEALGCRKIIQKEAVFEDKIPDRKRELHVVIFGRGFSFEIVEPFHLADDRLREQIDFVAIGCQIKAVIIADKNLFVDFCFKIRNNFTQIRLRDKQFFRCFSDGMAVRNFHNVF